MPIKLDGSSGYLGFPDKIVGSFPLSIICWVSYEANKQMFVAQQGSISADRYAAIQISANGSANYAVLGNPGIADSASVANDWPGTPTMRLCVAVFESTTARRIYVANATPGSSTANVVDDLSLHNQVTVGAVRNNGGIGSYVQGSVAEVHYVAGALTNANVTSLLSGTVGPETMPGWVDGWKLDTFNSGGTYTSIGGTRTLTATGGVTASTLTHPVTRSTTVTAPTISTQPAAQSVTAPATATFSVTATNGGGTLTYQWQRSNDGGTTWANVSAGTGGTSASYTTAATSAGDSGAKFRVTATNSNSGVTSNAVTLTVAAAAGTGGTITTSVVKNTGGSALASTTIPFVVIVPISGLPSLSNAVVKSNVATTSGSLLSVQDSGLTAGATYLVSLCDATGASYGATVCTAA